MFTTAWRCSHHRKMRPVYITVSSFFKVLFNVILPWTFRFPECPNHLMQLNETWYLSGEFYFYMYPSTVDLKL
jgi:hypothetical protein